MPDITAHAPDGTVHNFPDGTDPTVVDRVMKQYITGGAAPSTTTADAEMFQRRARGTKPELTRYASEHPLAAQGLPEDMSAGSIARGAFEGVGQLAEGAIGFGKQVLFPKGATEGERLKNIFKGVVTQPLQAEQQKAEQTTGPESVGHKVASYVPVVGPMAASAGEALGKRDIGGGTVLGGAALAPSVLASLRPHLDTAAKLLDRQIALNKGRVGLVNDVKRAGSLLENAVTGEQGEVGRHAQAVIAADQADLARTQSAGKVPTAGATLAGQAVINKTKMGGVAGTYQANMPLDSAKALITQLGREASRLERGGKAPEAASVWAEYDALRKATQDRADQLGTQFGNSWQHYIKEFHNYIQLNKGLFGHITQDADHIGILKKLTSGDYAAQVPEIKEWMRKYGVDSEPLDYAIKQGQKLEELSQQSKNLFIGKLRAIVRHPIAAGGAAAGASVVGHASGVPGMGFVLPLIVAGKVAGILDRREITSLLKSITKQVGPEMERVTPEPEGPRPVPTPPAAPAAPSAPTPGMSSPTMFGGQSKGALAGKLQGARQARASGVYKGKRP